MEEKQVKEDILFIKKMIEDSKRKVFDDGIYFIIWGILVAFACIGTFILIKMQNYTHINYLWSITYITGGVVSFIIGAIQRKKIPMTLLNKIVVSIWGSSIFVMVFLIFAALYSPYISAEITTFFPALILSLAHFVSGFIYENKILKITGVCWFASSLVFLFWVSAYNLLLFAFLIILLQVIPGIVLYWKYHNERV